MKQFIMQTISKVEYLKDIGQDATHEIMYNLITQKYSAGHIL